MVVIANLFAIAAQPAYAGFRSCSDWGISFTSAPSSTIQGGGSLSFGVGGFVSTKSYEVAFQRYTIFGNDGEPIVIGNVNGERTKTFTAGPPSTNQAGSYDINVHDTGTDEWCELGEFKIESSNSCDISVEQAGFTDTYCIDADSGEMIISVSNIFIDGALANNHKIHVSNSQDAFQYNENAVNGSIPDITFTPNQNRVGDSLTITVSDGEFFGNSGTLCSAEFTLIQACDDEDRTQPTSDTTFSLCEQIPKDSEAFGRCARCIAGQSVEGSGTPAAPEVPKGIWTAVGCIQNDPQSIITVVIKVGMGIAGGVALLMILAASFTLSTSQGDAKKTAEGKEMVSSAVIGLIFIIMSITMLEFIGVKIFRIPGFGE